jgi:hypothetical protein
MFLLGFADSIRADREREIADLIRQRRLLNPEPDPLAEGEAAAEPPEDGRSAAVQAPTRSRSQRSLARSWKP